MNVQTAAEPTSGFFDFMRLIPYYAQTGFAVERMNRRHDFVIKPLLAEIAGARVLDLAAHDGRWAYAFAGAGAASVLGIEGRQDLIDMYADFPATDFKDRVTLRQGDIFAEMEAEVRAGHSYDVIGVLGIYYHIMDHFRLLLLARQLQARLIIIDSTFVRSRSQSIQLIQERTDHVLNAIPQYPGQEVALKGVPTFRAMAALSRGAGFEISWTDWNGLPADQRAGVRDYFVGEGTQGNQLRATCTLRPPADGLAPGQPTEAEAADPAIPVSEGAARPAEARLPGFFDFLADVPPYSESGLAIARLNNRHRFFISPYAHEIAGARVLDLAAHDGRWAYAFAEAGAAQVLGVEGRQDLIDRFARFPETPFKSRVTLRQGDIFAALEDEVAAGRRHDVIGVLGIFYHIMDHQRLLDLVRRLEPKLVILDSEFFLTRGAMIRMHDERVDSDLNAIPQDTGRQRRAVGLPSFQATEMLARTAGFALTWHDWASLPDSHREGVWDYHRPTRARPYMLRATCVLRPI